MSPPKLDKEAARTEILRLWQELPQRRRQSAGNAIEFVESLDPKLVSFATLGNPKQIAVAWLVKLMDQAGAFRPTPPAPRLR
jgi:hypothetical protein